MLRPYYQYLLLALFLFTLCSPVAGQAVSADLLRPYVLSSNTRGDFVKTVIEVKEALIAGGFEFLGEYTPYADAHLIVVTHDHLKRHLAKDRNLAFALAQRISITRVNGQIQVAYANPDYFQHAYRLGTSMLPLTQALQSVLGRQETFGAKGMTAEKLRHYHYSYGMEYFDDQLELASYPSHKKALRSLQAALDRHDGGLHTIYRLDMKQEQVTIFGVAMTGESSGDEAIMSAVDWAPLRHSASLPYELVVDRRRVVALHPRFRLGIHFPDLKMVGEGGFNALRETPSAIIRALTEAASGSEK